MTHSEFNQGRFPVDRTGWRWPWILGGAGLLALPAVGNGLPFLFFDSIAYMTLPQSVHGAFPFLPQTVEPEVLAAANGGGVAGATPPLGEAQQIRGRSLAYRALGWLTHNTLGLWFLVALQAAITTLTLSILWQRGLGWPLNWGWLLMVTLLVAFTPLAVFTGMVMPDFLAAMLIVAAALLIMAWHRLLHWERWFLGGLAAYAMVSHTSHVALALALVVAIISTWPLWRRAGVVASSKGVLVIGLGILATIAFEVSINQIQERISGQSLLTRPHVTANLVDGGPGTAFLERACPDAPFVLCKYRDRLPMNWEKFLFGKSPEDGLFLTIPPEDQAAISAEHAQFALAVATDDPLAFATFALRATLAQMLDFRSAGAVIPPEKLERFGPTLEPESRPAWAESTINLYFDRLHLLDRLTQIVVVASLLLLGISATLLTKVHLSAWDRQIVAIVLILVAGLIANAIICGVLASPYGRFQARVVWLVPVAAIIAAGFLIRFWRERAAVRDAPT